MFISPMEVLERLVDSLFACLFPGQTQRSLRWGWSPSRSRPPTRPVWGRSRWRWTPWSAHWSKRSVRSPWDLIMCLPSCWHEHKRSLQRLCYRTKRSRSWRRSATSSSPRWEGLSSHTSYRPKSCTGGLHTEEEEWIWRTGKRTGSGGPHHSSKDWLKYEAKVVNEGWCSYWLCASGSTGMASS